MNYPPGAVRPLTHPLFLILFFTAIFFSACQREPENPALAYRDGIQLGLEGKFQEAHDAFVHVLEIDARYMPAEGSLKIARDVLDQAILPKTAVHLFRGIAFGNMGQAQQKILELNAAIESNPDYAVAYNERGIAYFNTERFQQAISDRDKAIELDPEYASPYYNKAIACEKIGLWQDAIEAYRGFLERAGKSFREHREYAAWRIGELERIAAESRHTS